LSTAWDVSTASYASKSFSHASETVSCSGLSFKPDGTKMYIVRNDSTDAIYQYTLSTAWDVSTASYDSKSLNVATQDTAPQGVAFKTDGTKLYLLGNSGDDLNEYDLSTAWDVSTGSYLQVGSISALSNTPMDLAFNSDGTTVFIADGSDDAIHSFNLSTAWDVSTLTAGDSFSTFVALDNTTMGFAIGDDSKFYHVSETEDTVYQYSFSTPATITWPGSVEWAAGTAAPDTGIGETDLLSFVTSDGGTSYLGSLVEDNLS
jgi:DNA-binding beta-propeller fold protein YncE